MVFSRSLLRLRRGNEPLGLESGSTLGSLGSFSPLGFSEQWRRSPAFAPNITSSKCDTQLHQIAPGRKSSLMDTRRYFLSIAFLVVIASIFVKLHTSRNTTFCYTSIATLSDTPRDANCFLVNEHGIFSKVYYLDDASAQKYKRVGHVLPGLWDGHGHLLQYGEMLESINLFGAKSLHDARKRVVKYARENPDEGTRDQWIRGIGWDQASFEGHMPTAVSSLAVQSYSAITSSE